MNLSRQLICAETSRKLLDAAPRLKDTRVLIGLDGFVDNIMSVVDKRHDHDRFDAVQKIERMGQKILSAAGQSSNYELVIKQQKLGGNSPIMGNALACAGLNVTCIGNLGYPAIHPVFADFGRRATLISIAEPGCTDALEFEDGKLMFNKNQTLGEVTWDNLLSRVGKERIKELVGQAKLVGMVNWTMLPHMSRIWAKLLDEVIPNMERHERKLFVDLADPEKRTAEDILEALHLLRRFQDQVDVILGLNLKESSEIADVLELPHRDNPEPHIEETAQAIRDKLGLSCVVIHPRRGAAAATAEHSAKFAGPFVQQPKISTGAGDHFNAGFAMAQTLGLGLEESLCTGVGMSGYYVRSAISPSAAELATFIAQLPDPQ